MEKINKIQKAQQIRMQNITSAKKDLANIVTKVDNTIDRNKITVTEACRSNNISTERYYRFKRNS
jgi:hypothetical protein